MLFCSKTHSCSECRVLQQDEQGNIVAICSLGAYDLGAALINAGWAPWIRNCRSSCVRN